jgi:hypothetical protein
VADDAVGAGKLKVNEKYRKRRKSIIVGIRIYMSLIVILIVSSIMFDWFRILESPLGDTFRSLKGRYGLWPTLLFLVCVGLGIGEVIARLTIWNSDEDAMNRRNKK